MALDIQVSLRLPPAIVARAEALLAPLSEVPELQMLRLERAAVIRLAIFRGLAVLEAEHSATNKAKARAKARAKAKPATKAPAKAKAATKRAGKGKT